MTPPDQWIDTQAPATGPPPESSFAFFLWAARGMLPVITLAMLLNVAVGFFDVVIAWLLGQVIDAATNTGTAEFWSRHSGLAIAFAGFFLLVRPAIFGATAYVNGAMVAPNLTTLTFRRIFRWSLGQSVSFFDDDFAGRIAQKQMQVARSLTEIVVETANVVAFALATLVATVILLASISWVIAAILGVWLVLYGLMIGWFLPRIKHRAGERAGARAALTGQAVDIVSNIRTVKLFARVDDEERQARQSSGDLHLRMIDFGRFTALFRICLFVLAGILPVALIGGTTWLWSIGNGSIGEIAAAGSIAIRLSQMSGWASFALMGLFSNIGEMQDGVKTLVPPRRVDDKPNAPDLSNGQGAVRFDNVSFAYGEGRGDLRDISLSIAPGEKLGIVGPSGAGKSTLVALLLRLYQPNTGRIEIGGEDISNVTQDSLRRAIGMVTQDTAMFNRSARDNILYGAPDASKAALTEAIRLAAAEEFVTTLADHKGRTGLAAHLGERGVKLSGGQRQRIALARVILKNAPILVLDEATSALDSESEQLIQDALGHVMTDKTVIAIAHRLSTLAQMDRIIVMEDGRIAEQGDHEALLSQGGLYARLWAHQTGGFLNTAAE